MPNEHAKFSPSSSTRYINCPASLQLEEKEADTSSKYAALGTAAHALGEQCLMLGCSPEKFKGDTIEGFKVDDDMATAVGVYVNYINSIESKKKLMVEERVDITDDCWGTADCIVLAKRVLHIIDYKNGEGTLYSPSCDQLKIYALGAMYKLNQEGFIDDYDTVRATIVQPRYHGVDAVRCQNYKKSELSRWHSTCLKPSIDKAIDEKCNKVKAGPWCKFCKAKKAGTCPIYRDKIKNAAVDVFQDMETMDTEIQNYREGSEITLPNPEDMSADELGKWLDLAHIFSDFESALNGHAKRRAERGEKIPHHKLIHGRRSRSWKDKAEAEKFLKNTLKDEAYKKKLITVSQAEKKLKKKGGTLKKELVHVNQKVKLVTEDAKGKEIEGPEEIFANILK